MLRGLKGFIESHNIPVSSSLQNVKLLHNLSFWGLFREESFVDWLQCDELSRKSMNSKVDLAKSSFTHDLSNLVELRASNRRVHSLLESQAHNPGKLDIFAGPRTQIRITDGWILGIISLMFKVFQHLTRPILPFNRSSSTWRLLLLMLLDKRPLFAVVFGWLLPDLVSTSFKDDMFLLRLWGAWEAWVLRCGRALIFNHDLSSMMLRGRAPHTHRVATSMSWDNRLRVLMIPTEVSSSGWLRLSGQVGRCHSIVVLISFTSLSIWLNGNLVWLSAHVMRLGVRRSCAWYPVRGIYLNVPMRASSSTLRVLRPVRGRIHGIAICTDSTVGSITL